MTTQYSDGYYWCSVRNQINAFDAPVQIEGDTVYVLVGSNSRTHIDYLYDATLSPLLAATAERITLLTDLIAMAGCHCEERHSHALSECETLLKARAWLTELTATSNQQGGNDGAASED